ncbi:hypothetical protein V6N11_030643 [Hibiscus sabdariffa]|uniref:Uncharacterized protein n=2 Tax=Hibiscus sabdariffa TaxID=183260 RepID=A0ABR2NME3_9ROSI
MLPNEPYWNENLVRRVFTPDDAQKILLCPIAATRAEPFLWFGHSSGCYTTKYEYLWLLKTVSRPAATKSIWKTISKLQTLPRIFVFAWRACHEALPTGNRLLMARIGNGLSSV